MPKPQIGRAHCKDILLLLLLNCWSGLPFPSPTHESKKWKWSHAVVSDSLQPHGLQPTRLLRPWDFPGKSTGVGCHRLLQRYSRTQKLPFLGSYLMYLRKKQEVGKIEENELEFRKHRPNPGFSKQKSQRTASTAGLEMSFQIRVRTQWGPKRISLIRKEYIPHCR